METDKLLVIIYFTGLFITIRLKNPFYFIIFSFIMSFIFAHLQ